MIDLILGTAGHIDHGKTSLVRSLTGADTDRLPEEKRRGITIDLGFAELLLGDCRLGIVDVPGHERFVRNMLAGASGIDLALMVVAADDSVKPQTREHLEILRLLDLEQGVIALTKCDLAEPDWLDLVEAEVRDLVAGTFLAEAPLVRTSNVTGHGLDELRRALHEAARKAKAGARMRRIAGPFRMAIDRTFTMPGHGTVVTGSIASGRVRPGDSLVIEPGGITVRVRGVQNHDRPVDEAHRGQRAAVNLAGIHHNAVRRGQELAAPGHLAPSRLITAQMTLLSSAPRPLKNRDRIRVHMGTAEFLAIVSLLNRERLAPGEECIAQLYLAEPAVAGWGQPLVVRSESPMTTIGGGRVLDPSAAKIRRGDEASLKYAADLRSSDEARRAAAALFLAGLRSWRPEALARTAGISDIELATRRLVESGDLLELRLSPTRTIQLHREVFERLGERILHVLEKMHEREPLHSLLDRSRLASRFDYLGEAGLFDAALAALARSGNVRLAGPRVGLAGRGPKLSKNEQKLLEQLVETFRRAGFPPPTVEDCQAEAVKHRDWVPQLLSVAAADGLLVEIGPGFYLHEEADRTLKEQLAAKWDHGAGLTVAEIRDMLGATRKHVVPYCEYLDRTGFTRREGDLRFVARTEKVRGTPRVP
jgi:selenocysteine-specific elongation factor